MDKETNKREDEIGRKRKRKEEEREEGEELEEEEDRNDLPWLDAQGVGGSLTHLTHQVNCNFSDPTTLSFSSQADIVENVSPYNV